MSENSEAALDGSKGSRCFRPPLNINNTGHINNVNYSIGQVIMQSFNAEEVGSSTYTIDIVLIFFFFFIKVNINRPHFLDLLPAQ